MSEDSPAIGIDLGTTYCCVAYMNSNQTVEIIENTERFKSIPSYVAFTDEGVVTGRTAKETKFRKSENVVYDVKRLIGQKLDNEFLHGDKQYNWPFKVISSGDNTPLIEINSCGKTNQYKPQEITAILLKYMKTVAEKRLGTEVRNAVITVPANFNYHQRTATKEAGELAGLNVLKIINEPTAAALAYVHKNEISGGTKNVLVFDLGGGTFDASIVTVEGQTVTVRATAGNTTLGGRDFENNLSEFIADKIEKRYKKEATNTVPIRRIGKQSEKLKINLSSDVNTLFELDSLADDEDVDFEISRNEFDQINSRLFQSCINIVEDCLKDAKMSKADIDKIVLVGGSTRIPKIQEMLTNYFEGKQLTKAINPDEAVAYGAAVQAAMSNKSYKTELHYVVNDVTPLSIGTVAAGDIMNVLIPRNSKIPISESKSYCTIEDYQKIAPIEIYEGESSLVQHNTLIGTYTVELPAKPPGYLFHVVFHVNADGMLEVSAKTDEDASTSLDVKYTKPDQHTTNVILPDAEIKKTKDNEKGKVSEKDSTLFDYCVIL